MAFIASLFKFHLHDSASPLLLQPYSLSFVRIVRVALKSLRPQLRVLGCGVLASPVLAELDAGSLPLYPFEEGLKLAEDEDASVRVAACRVLGLLVKSSLFVSVRSCPPFAKRFAEPSFAEYIVAQIDNRSACSTLRRSGTGASVRQLVPCKLLRHPDAEVRQLVVPLFETSLIPFSRRNSRAINTASLVHEALLLALPVNGEKVHQLLRKRNESNAASRSTRTVFEPSDPSSKYLPLQPSSKIGKPWRAS